MKKDVTETMAFKSEDLRRDNIRHIVRVVDEALKERGYNSVNQLAGYLISNDPAYISSHQNARSIIQNVERYEIIEEMVRTYLELIKKMKVLGLDLGSRTCGVAVSDVMGFLARPVETVRFDDDDYDTCFDKLMPIIKELQVKKVVLGLPKHMNGDVGIRGEISIQFKQRLEEAGLEVILWDERLTTVAAERILISADMSRKKRKKVIDQMAAVQILQGYLDSNQ